MLDACNESLTRPGRPQPMVPQLLDCVMPPIFNFYSLTFVWLYLIIWLALPVRDKRININCPSLCGCPSFWGNFGVSSDFTFGKLQFSEIFSTFRTAQWSSKFPVCMQVHFKFELMPETLFLTINLIDRYLCQQRVSRRLLQLVGITAMLVAAKYEEIWAPQVWNSLDPTVINR